MVTVVIGLLLLPFSLSVGLSRMFFGLHHPSDILAGALLGSGMAATRNPKLPPATAG